MSIFSFTLIFAMAALSICLVMVAIRFAIGPTLPDRITAFDLFVANVIGIELLAAASRNFSEQCVRGLQATSQGPDMVERGLMLGTALALKMVAYVGFAPFAAIGGVVLHHQEIFLEARA